jgi:competence protein ComEA
VSIGADKPATKDDKAASATTINKSTAKDDKSTTKTNKPTSADAKPETVLDLNKATQAELQELPGVGEATAKKIVKGRPYKSVDDLSKAGVSASTLAKIRSRLSVGGETTVAKQSKAAVVDSKTALVNLNKASETELEAVSGIGPSYARKIIQGRPYKSIDDLSKAGIPAATISKIRPLVTISDAAASHTTVAKPVTPDTTPDLLDVNKATAEQLQEVPGIGEAYSKKIVDNRPYKSIDDLSKAGIPAAILEKVKSHLTVGGTTAAAPPAKGMVWVNLETKLYHNENSRWYGKTKSGKYMTEAEAEKAGYKASKQ